MAKRKREKKLHLWHPSPWDGKPGFGAAFMRLLFNVIGPAAMGSHRSQQGEAPARVERPVDPPCPACGQPMDLHTITRGGPGKATHMICPNGKSD